MVTPRNSSCERQDKYLILSLYLPFFKTSFQNNELFHWHSQKTDFFEYHHELIDLNMFDDLNPLILLFMLQLNLSHLWEVRTDSGGLLSPLDVTLIISVSVLTF